jgi:hypothetical protein
MNRTKERRMLPRFEGGSRHRPETFARGLPDRLLDAMAAEGAPEVARHRTLRENFEKAQERTVDIAAKVAQTKADDQGRREEALAAGKPRPAPRSEKLDIELDQRREDVSLLAELLRTSAYELLVASAPFAAAALQAAEREAEASVERVRELLEAVRAALEQADKLGGEVAWIAGLDKTGIVHPWSHGTRARVLPIARQAILTAIGGLEEDLIRRQENVEARERHDDAEEKRLPPGARIFREGKEYRATESGELEEVER